jgi:hypothetical protein
MSALRMQHASRSGTIGTAVHSPVLLQHACRESIAASCCGTECALCASRANRRVTVQLYWTGKNLRASSGGVTSVYPEFRLAYLSNVSCSECAYEVALLQRCFLTLPRAILFLPRGVCADPECARSACDPAQKLHYAAAIQSKVSYLNTLAANFAI